MCGKSDKSDRLVWTNRSADTTHFFLWFLLLTCHYSLSLSVTHILPLRLFYLCFLSYLFIFLLSLPSCMWFLILPNTPRLPLFPSNPSSRGPIRRQGSASRPGAAGLFGWIRWKRHGLRCHTRSPFTPTLVLLSASTASVCSKVSSARACSAKVGWPVKTLLQRMWNSSALP